MATVDHDAAEQSPGLKSYYDNKRLLIRNVFLVMLGGSAAGLGLNTAVNTLMPLHMKAVGMNAWQNAVAMSLNGWLGLPLILYLSYLTDHWQSKWGRRLPFLAMSLPFLVIGIAIFPHLTGVITCMLTYGLISFFVQIKYDTYPLLVYDVAKNRYWGRINGINFLTMNLFIWLGQVWLMPGVDAWGKNTAYGLCAFLVLVLTLPALFLIKEPPIRSSDPPRYNPVPVIGKVLKLGFLEPRAILIFLAYSLVCGQWLVQRFVTLQADNSLGLSTGAIGKDILQAGTIVGLFSAYLAGWAADKIGSVKTLVLGTVMAFAAAYFGFHPHSVGDLRLAYSLSMASGNFTYIPAILFVVMNVRRQDLASYTACNGAVNLFMNASLLMVTGWLIENLFARNYGLAFVMAAILVVPALGLFILLDKWRRQDLAAAAVASRETGSV